MANFVSSLTGQQINDVMTKIEQGVPEGYAVGEKNGVPVSSSSVYYHNNAKYYAENANNALQQANAAAARAEAAVPPSTAGAVFFDRAQTLSEAQKSQVQKNIGAGSNNPNLCDNPFFSVNRRGFTTITTPNGNQYTVDRWFVSASQAGYTVTLTDNGLALENNSTSSAYLQQRIPKLGDNAVGKPLTLSVLMSDGTIYSATRASIPTRSASTQNIINLTAVTGLILRLVYGATTDAGDTIQLIISASASFSVRAVKLEIGGNSTLSHDTYPNYGEEVVKCASATVVPSDNFANQPVTFASNRNILDNWWFGTGIINQRGVTSGDFTDGRYRFDRWQTTYGTSPTGGTWELTSDGLVITSDTSAVYFRQKIENVGLLTGKKLTASIMMADGSIYCGTMQRTTGDQSFSSPTTGLALMIHGGGLRFGATAGHSFTIKAVKLEVGTMSTLHLDAPPNPAEELAKCQRYLIKIGPGYKGLAVALSASAADLAIQIPPMRTTPTLSKGGTITLQTATGTSFTPTSITVTGADPNAGFLVLKSYATNLTQAAFYRFVIGSDGYIILVAEL